MMAEESNTKIAANFQSFLTDTLDGRQDLNTDLPTGDTIRFIQFCRGMARGFKMACYTDIANQSVAVMVSNQRKGRQEAVESLIGMDRKEKTRWTFGPQFTEMEEGKKGKR